MTNTPAASQPAAPGTGRAYGVHRFRAPYLPTRTMVHGTAFAVMCLWMRVSPDALRRRLGTEAAFEGAVGA